MFTMKYDIRVGDYSLGMLDKVEINRSVELLADTAVITLPAVEYNIALDIETKIRRGDKVTISLGYEETGMAEEFTGWVQRVGTDNGTITLECEDDLYLFRKALPEARIYYLTGDVPPKAIKNLGLTGIDYSFGVLSQHPEWIAEAHALGLEVNVWTVNKEEDLRQCIAWGVDYITPDYPERLQALLK